MNFEIRPIEVKDARGVNALRRMPGVFENILGIPSERYANSVKFIEGCGPNDHLFVAIVEEAGEEVVIGTIGLHVSSNHRTRHTAIFGIMVHKDYQGHGVGKALLATIIDLADNWLKLVRIELTVFHDNEKAIKLYEKFGFEKEGLKRKAAVRNGEYTDEILMARIRNV